jgi:hypothetical protein
MVGFAATLLNSIVRPMRWSSRSPSGYAAQGVLAESRPSVTPFNSAIS